VPSDGTGGERLSAAKRRKRRKRKESTRAKAAKVLADEHVAKILGYLRASRLEHGLLINFGAPRFEIKKYALSQPSQGRVATGLTAMLLSIFASLAPFRGWFGSAF
jgi:PD-(D/E)XK nuclease superfamily